MATVSRTGPATAPPPPFWRRWLRRALWLAAAPYLGVAALLAVWQRSLIYLPTCVDALPPSQIVLSQASIEAVALETDDGLSLNGWWMSAIGPAETAEQEPADRHSGNRPLVLFFCGNGGHRGYRAGEFEVLTRAGADVLCCDYRGYGDNPGKPSEAGLATDARAVWNFATNVRGIPSGRIVVYGESLGGGVAVRLAADLCAAGMPPAALVVRSTFSSLEDVAAEIFPWLPVRRLLVDRFLSTARIGQVTCPILMLHGLRDTIIPYRFGKKLFDAAPDKSLNGIAKRMVDLPNADHNDVLETDGRAFSDALNGFLSAVVPAASGGR